MIGVGLTARKISDPHSYDKADSSPNPDRWKYFYNIVLVVFENKSAEDGFILIEEGAHLLMKDQVEHGTKNNPAGDIQTMDEIRNSQNIQQSLIAIGQASLPSGQLATTAGGLPLTAGSALGAAGLVVFLIPAVIIGEHQAKLSIVQKNITEKELIAKTVYPGGSHSGFLYFFIPKREDLKNVEGVVLNLKNIRSNETRSMKIGMK